MFAVFFEQLIRKFLIKTEISFVEAMADASIGPIHRFHHNGIFFVV
jgi:hypothetical protein